MIIVRMITDHAPAKLFGTVLRMFAPWSPASLAASGSWNSASGRSVSSARKPATMKAVSETCWMSWDMGLPIARASRFDACPLVAARLADKTDDLLGLGQDRVGDFMSAGRAVLEDAVDVLRIGKELAHLG